MSNNKYSHNDAIMEMQDKLNLLDGDRDRKATMETKQRALQKNIDTLEMVKKENNELKETLKKLQKEVGGNNGEKSFQEKEYERLETILHLKRQEFDELQAIARNLQKTIRKKEDKLGDFNKEKAPILTDDSPLTRQIRILENRLDKAMIKYNEAQSIKKTYEQILERLKEERIGFDNQLQAIERTLKAKDKDYIELLNMSRDANYLRELAKNELTTAKGEFEESVRDMRKELDEKKKYVEARVNLTTDLAKKEANRRRNQDEEGSKKFRSSSASQQNSSVNKTQVDEERDRLQGLEEKWRKIKEVTGVDDVNEVIQKFLSSSDTHKNLEQMTKESQKRIEHLTEKRAALKARLEDLKYSQSSGLGSRRIVDEFIQQLSEAQSKNERQKQQFERIAKILVNVKAGTEHLNDKMAPALVDLSMAENLSRKFIEEIARGEDISLNAESARDENVSMSTVSLGTQSNEERHIVNLLAQCYVNLSAVLESLPSEEELFQETLKSTDSFDFNQSKNNIRIKINHEDNQDSESEDDDDDKEAELISRLNVKKKAEKLMSKTKVVKK
ncbi:axonemal dynein intermediate chain protein [Naegleria gruberi]|uniref:Axonemal dynein intermediate chain protein n=1 Tax=Naegleria gruberi TaxID=5762 RepID=D2V860_NAEGR|nr:axonemal dynein intermediate chain protein [Naegleria gruberi]EFC46989.1 axonemal dynein intermediate chain protein [Naegleria gruberi]|eukprot:XP_002679733.1 axonemal dynein intermediate chain protein [Naegleria gruberi strain NEG-M]